MKFNLLFFVRLLLGHIWLLIIVPIILAGLVFYLTQDEPKVYSSKARIYTGIASGSTIELDNTKLDFRATNTAYDNLLNLIKSRTTLETVGLKLFTQHMMLDSVDSRIITKEKYNKLQQIVPEDVKALVVPSDVQKTFDNFTVYKNANHTNFIYELINLTHPDYSIEKILGRINVRRILSSDFVDITFESEDPGICQNTLLILAEVFVKLNAEIKVNQSDAVVKYFDKQLNVSTGRLKGAEEELLDFNRSHKIINYYEQTKHIASEKEHFELEYQKVYIKHHASKAVLKNLESKLGTHVKKRLSSEEILALRDEMSKLNFDISMRTLGIEKDSVEIEKDAMEVADLSDRVKIIKGKLTSAVDTIFSIDHDTNGVATSSILTDWLENTIAYEGTSAQLKVMDKKRLEFEELYEIFAPLGATMKRLERKIDIAEREYLSLLHSLGLAKLRQQNVELKSNIKLTEVPFYPITPKASKRKILIVVAGLMGFILVAFSIFILEFLDSNLNTAPRASEKIGLEVSSIFPVINYKDKNIDFDYVENKAVNAISRRIILNQFKKEDERRPLYDMMFSTQEKEGKSYIAQNLLSKLCELGYKVLHVTYDPENVEISSENYTKIPYAISDQLYKISSVEEFDELGVIKDIKTYDFAIIEIPSIVKHPFPVKLVAMMDDIFLVTRANRAWSEADKNALNLFKEATSGPEPTLILNGVKVMEMETVLGEMGTKTSRLRKWLKRVVQFRFFTKNEVA